MRQQSKPSVRWWIDKQALFVRFNNMNRSTFEATLEMFKADFRHATWRKDVKAWKLLLTDLERLRLFTCQLPFSGARNAYSDSTSKQLSLPLKWGSNPVRKCNRRRKYE